MTTTTTAIETNGKCRWCGGIHGAICPEVRAIEYHQNGTVKRVEFMSPAERFVPMTWGPQPNYGPSYGTGLTP